MFSNGKHRRSKRSVKTPKRFKGGACLNIDQETPTRGRPRSASADRETPEPKSISETTKEMSNRQKCEYMAIQMDKLVTVVTMLTSAFGGINIPY